MRRNSILKFTKQWALLLLLCIANLSWANATILPEDAITYQILTYTGDKAVTNNNSAVHDTYLGLADAGNLTAGEKWTFYQATANSGEYFILNQTYGQMADMALGSQASGKLLQWEYNGTDNQIFYVHAVSGSQEFVQLLCNSDRSKAVTVQKDGSLLLTTDLSNTNTYFKLKKLDEVAMPFPSAHYRIKSLKTGSLLTSRGNYNDAAPIYADAFESNKEQTFVWQLRRESSNDSYFQLYSPYGFKALDAALGDTKRPLLWPASYSNSNQLFYLNGVTGKQGVYQIFAWYEGEKYYLSVSGNTTKMITSDSDETTYFQFERVFPEDLPKSDAYIVDVVDNYSSGIAGANLTTTLNDGTILGFYHSGSYVHFCGAISQQPELTIPDSVLYYSEAYAVESVGYNGCDFDNARSVTSLTLPKTITNIYSLPTTVKILHAKGYISSVYSNELSNLNKVLVPQSTLSSYFGNTAWSNYVLINAEGTAPLRITINMTKAGEFAQLLLQQISGWYMVNELTVIGELNNDDLNVFKRMKQLTKLDLSRAVITSIPNQFDGASSTGGYRDGFNILEELSLPEVDRIGDYAFAQCYRLENITMPKVNTIGYGAFSNLGASQITLPEGITSIGEYAFYESNLQSITIPSTITEVSNYCFSTCSSLKSASIPSSVTKIGYQSFRETGLTSINLPGVTSISSRAFYNCKQLADVTFTEGLYSMEDEPFYGCTALTEIDLPSTFTSMSGSAFKGCSNIKKVISRAVTPPTHNNYGDILYGCDKTNIKLYVPAMSIDKYRKESGWKEFYTILPLEDKTSNIHIYDYATIDDASEFTTDCCLTLNWIYQNRNGSSQYYCGALDYSGYSTLSIHDYKQVHHMGRSNSNNPYSYGAHFTSLISNGAMRSDNVQTTLRIYDTNTWYFISLPYDVKVSEITYTDGTQFAIRKYSGNNRAMQIGNTWVNLTTDDTMNAYEGYILRCNKQDADFTFPAINNTNKNKVFEKESIVMPLGEYLSEFEHNRSWNLIGNPYPCYYDTRYMDFTAPITVWNRYNARYDAYSPVDDSYILHPAQSFFVQRPIDQESITFDKDGRQKNATVKDLQTKVRRRVAVDSHRKIFNILMSNGAVEDHTRFVVNSNASLAYELDKDASKFIADDNAAMLVYTVENGVRYAINERPMADGIVSLGFYANEDGNYSLSLNTEEDDNIILIDHEANTETALSGEYRFTAKAGYNDSRFTIIFGETTDISTINFDNCAIPTNSPYSVYTIDGRLVGNYNTGTNAHLSKGVYVIYSKEVKRKIVIK